MDYSKFLAIAESIIEVTVLTIQKKSQKLSASLPISIERKIQDQLTKTPDEVLQVLQQKIPEPQIQEQDQPLSVDSLLDRFNEYVEQLYSELDTIENDSIKYLSKQVDKQGENEAQSAGQDVIKGRRKWSKIRRSSSREMEQEIIQYVQEGNETLAAGKVACILKDEKLKVKKVRSINLENLKKQTNNEVKVSAKMSAKRANLGLIKFSNGTSYEGEWLGDVRDGQGTEIFPGGIKYTGEYQGDEFHGHGCLEYPDGRRYKGEFVNGQRHGNGEECDSSGIIYQGQWNKGVKHGQFTIILPQKKKPLEKKATQTSAISDRQTARGNNSSREEMIPPLSANWKNGIPVNYDHGAHGPSVKRVQTK